MMVVLWFLGGLLYCGLYCFIYFRLVCKGKFTQKRKVVISCFIFALFYVFIMKCDLKIFQPYIIHFVLFLILLWVFEKKLVITLIGILEIFLIVCFSEIAYGLITVFLFRINVQSFNDTPFGYICSNISIFLISILLCRTRMFFKLFKNILKWYNQNDYKVLSIFVVLTLTIVVFVLYNNYVIFLPTYVLVVTNVFCIGIIVFVVCFFKEKAYNNKIVTEYDQLLNYVKVYEDAVEEKNKKQHEYSNQLILIKGMINKKNKNAINYIDELLNNENESEDINLLNKLKYVPQGGLKGLIYYKMQEMQKKNVKVFVDVSSQLEKSSNCKAINRFLEDISKVIGVYIDNAIEAVKNLKEKYIIIEFYLEDKCIVFSISNNYDGIIEIENVKKEGYTTKGIGHGYGLSLVKDIIAKNDRLEQKTELNGIYFVQKLYIKK